MSDQQQDAVGGADSPLAGSLSPAGAAPLWGQVAWVWGVLHSLTLEYRRKRRCLWMRTELRHA